MNTPRAAQDARSTAVLVPFWLACGCFLVLATALAADPGHPVPASAQVGGASGGLMANPQAREAFAGRNAETSDARPDGSGLAAVASSAVGGPPDGSGGSDASGARAIRLEGDFSFSFQWLFPMAAVPLLWRLWKARRSGARKRT